MAKIPVIKIPRYTDPFAAMETLYKTEKDKMPVGRWRRFGRKMGFFLGWKGGEMGGHGAVERVEPRRSVAASETDSEDEGEQEQDGDEGQAGKEE